MGCKVLKISVTYPMGVGSEATRRVYFVRTVNTPSGWPLSSPEGRLRFYSIPCTPRVPWEFTGLGHFGPKWSESAQKGGTPCFGQFFRKIPGTHPTLSPKSEKKWPNPPPAGPSAGGGGFPHFFPKFGEHMVRVPGIFPGSCFLEGGL